MTTKLDLPRRLSLSIIAAGLAALLAIALLTAYTRDHEDRDAAFWAADDQYTAAASRGDKEGMRQASKTMCALTSNETQWCLRLKGKEP